MQYTNLGRTGLKVSRICLGCMSFGDVSRGQPAWALSEEDSRPFFRRALEAGINFFDTANGYARGTSEEITGRALNDMALRDEIVIATKAFLPWRTRPNTGGLSRKALFQAVDDSLKRLNTDYIDLYQIHRFDYDTPIEETMEALHDIVKSGRVRYIGASSMFAWQFAKMQTVAERNGWTRFVSMQPEVSLLYREEEREMIPLCMDQGVAVLPWSPLAGGKLARPWAASTERSATDTIGKERAALSVDNDHEIVDAVNALAKAHGLPPAQIALAWLLARPGITAPIIGATKLVHLDDAVAALDVHLSEEEASALETVYHPHPVIGLSGVEWPAWRVTVRTADGS